jgi:hypothetical protein
MELPIPKEANLFARSQKQPLRIRSLRIELR